MEAEAEAEAEAEVEKEEEEAHIHTHTQEVASFECIIALALWNSSFQIIRHGNN